MAGWLKRLVRSLRPKANPSLRAQFPQYEIGVGSYCVGQPALRVHRGGVNATLRMGAYCSIATGVRVYLGGEHNVNWVTTYPFPTLWPAARGIPGHPHTKGDVCIGNDVWIAADSMILSGVTIGDGAVIGARSVVARDIPPYAIAAGNPARVLRMRFDEDVIEALQAIRWWDWPADRIERALPLLLSPDIRAFLDAVEQGHV